MDGVGALDLDGVGALEFDGVGAFPGDFPASDGVSAFSGEFAGLSFLAGLGDAEVALLAGGFSGFEPGAGFFVGELAGEGEFEDCFSVVELEL